MCAIVGAVESGMKLVLVAGFVAGMAALGANAATFDFKAASTGGWKDSITFSPMDGIGLTVSGTATTGAAAKVQTWQGFGLGVKSSADCDSGRSGLQCIRDDHQVDSSGPDDVAVFLFTEAVRITSISFNYVDTTDVFDFLIDDGNALTEKLSTLKVMNTVELNNDFFAKLFGIGAGETTIEACYTTGRNRNPVCVPKVVTSAFKITSITVEKPVSQVPLPASALLLVGAFGGLSLMRRRSRSA